MKKWRIALLVSILIVFGELTYLSIARYRSYNVAMNDLGNMAQAIWSATKGQPLVMTSVYGPVSRLALHVELIYFLLAPLYALFPSPLVLLIIQAGLFVAGAVPLHLLAMRRLENPIAVLAVVWVYLLYPVAQSAVLFDFHGDTLAMPLLLFALEALDRRAWIGYALWLVLALSCKFYIAVPVAALGAMLFLRQNRRVGALTLLVGVCWGLVTCLVIRPTFAPLGDVALEQTTTFGYVRFYFAEFFGSLDVTWRARIANAVVVFLPVILPMSQAAWWWMPTLAIGIPPLVSSGPGPSYSYAHHHYAVVVPFAMMGLVDGLAVMRHRRTVWRRGRAKYPVWSLALQLTTVLSVTFCSFFLDTPLNPGFWDTVKGARVNPLQYRRTSRDAMKDAWLSESVPAQSPIAASHFIASHLVNRETVYSVSYFEDYVEEVDYVIADALLDYVQVYGPNDWAGGATYEWSAIDWTLKRPEFELVDMRDGLLLIARNPADAQPLAQTIERVPIATPVRVLETFADEIGLVDFHIEPVSDRVWRSTWCWLPLRSLDETSARFAVSRLEGVPNARFLHLPTSISMPTPTWSLDHKVCERFDIVIPHEVRSGSYPLIVGWYDSGHPFAFATDSRSCVGQEQRVGDLNLP